MNPEATTLQTLLADHQLYHSEFQMDYFITTKAGGTTYGYYKQALRELFKRYRGLKELLTSKQLLQVDIDELEHKIKSNNADEFEQRRSEIKLCQNRMGMEDLERNIGDTTREFKHFYNQALGLKEQIGELTDEVRKQLDEDMWRHQIKMMAAIDYIQRGRLGESVMSMLQSTPKGWRMPLVQEIKNADNIIKWFEQYDLPLPKHHRIEDVNVKALLE